MKELLDLENYIRCIPQSNTLQKEKILGKIVEKKKEWKEAQKGDIQFIKKNIQYMEEGDLFSFDIAGCLHPAMAILVKEGIVHAVTLTSKDRIGRWKVEGSRMFPASYFCPTIVAAEESYALLSWFGVFDVPLELKRIKKELQLYYTKLFKDANNPSKKKVESSTDDKCGQAEEGTSILQNVATL